MLLNTEKDSISKPQTEIPFFRPSLDNEEEKAVIDCIRSGWLTTGKINEKFEQNIKNFIGGDVEVASVNSATAGLHLAIEALNIGPGDEVIIPSLTFTATAEVIRYVGAKPVFTDVDYDTLNITPEHILSKITPATKAVIVVHFAGLPVRLNEIISLCKSKGIFVIEDAAHAFGSNYEGRKIGNSDSDAVIFSFYANKNITTGEGGALLTKNKNIAKNVRISRSHGIDRNTFFRYKSNNKLDYDVIRPGYKYNLSDIAASIGLVQLKKCEKLLSKRKKLAKAFFQNLHKIDMKFFFTEEDYTNSSFHILPIWVDHSIRDKFVSYLAEAGIITSLHYKPLHLMSYWRTFCQGQTFANAEKYYSGAISLPLFPNMTDSEVEYVVEKSLEFFGAGR